MDKYKNFAELKKNEQEGKDYIIRCRYTDSEIALMAPHGGGIEPGTIDLADAVAENDFSFYAFIGIKKRGNSVLHITSTGFDEPVALDISRNANTVISVHGCSGDDDTIYMGGKDHNLKHKISIKLADAGFNVKESKDKELKGENDFNICNRCKSGKGVQLEITKGLRQKMFEHSESVSGDVKTEIFYRFVGAVRNTLLYFNKEYDNSFGVPKNNNGESGFIM